MEYLLYLKHIKNRSKNSYRITKTIKLSCCEVAHYFERATIALFHPIPDECLYY